MGFRDEESRDLILNEALAAARSSTEYMTWKHTAFVAVAKYTPEARRATTVSEAFAVSKLVPVWYRPFALDELTPSLSDTLLREALAVALEIRDEIDLVRALARIASVLTGSERTATFEAGIGEGPSDDGLGRQS